MTPFSVLAALALFTFAPTPTPKAKAAPEAKPENTGAPTAGTPDANDPTRSPRAVTPPERGPQGTGSYAALVRCQMACDETKSTANMERASCKLVCLKTFPSVPRKYVFVPAKRPEATRKTPPPRPGEPRLSPRRQPTPQK